MENDSVFWAMVAAIAAAVSAIVSLVQQIGLKKRQEELRRVENKALWYNTIVLDNLIPMLNHAIDQAERGLQNCKGRTSDQFKEALHEVYNTMSEDFKLVDGISLCIEVLDRNLYLKCSANLNHMRDFYTAKINQSLINNQVVSYSADEIYEKKSMIITDLWEYAMKNDTHHSLTNDLLPFVLKIKAGCRHLKEKGVD